MQILQWLFKVTQEEEARETTPTSKKTTVKEAESKDLALLERGCAHPISNKSSEQGELKQRESDSITILVGRRNSRACFRSSLNLKRLVSFHRRQHCLHPVRSGEEVLGRGLTMGHKMDSPAHVGNKVLPICDATITAATTFEQYGSLEKKEKLKGDKAKAISRMKELWKWAATAKSEKGGNYIARKVLNFRNRGAVKAAPHDDEDESLSSPKISFKWDTCSCSTSSSAYSTFSTTSSRNDRKWIKPSSISIVEDVAASDESTTTIVIQECSSREGNWITTDDEFVVLEL